MKNIKKTLALVLAVTLLVGIAVGATIAWLTAEADEVVNTFNTSTIKVGLTETEETYKMIPGWTIHKDPKASVPEGSEDAYLFVTIEESTNAKFGDYMTYEIADGWTLVPGQTNAYYRTVMAADTEREFSILKGDKVNVKDSVTKQMMDSLTAETYPTLTFQAFAVQYKNSNTGNFTAQQAWEVLFPPAT